MPDQNAVYVFATLTAAPGRSSALRLILQDLVTATRQEPGNLHYDLYEAADAPGTYLFHEAYKNQEAVDAHMASPHFKAAMAEAGPLFGSPPIVNLAKQIG